MNDVVDRRGFTLGRRSDRVTVARRPTGGDAFDLGGTVGGSDGSNDTDNRPTRGGGDR